MSTIIYECTCGNELEVKEKHQESIILHPCEVCLNEKYDEGSADGWDNGYDEGFSEGED